MTKQQYKDMMTYRSWYVQGDRSVEARSANSMYHKMVRRGWIGRLKEKFK